MKKLFLTALCIALSFIFIAGCNVILLPESASSNSVIGSGSSSNSNSSTAVNNEKYYISITGDKEISLSVGETYQIEIEITPNGYSGTVEYGASSNCVSVSYSGEITATYSGSAEVYATIENSSDSILVTVTEENAREDIYENINVQEFYANYTPAIDYIDSQYRTKHSLMSGDISEQAQAPTITANRPQEQGKNLKNSEGRYSSDGNVYYVVDSTGEVVKEIYKGGAYVTLEEVSAYLFAFNDIPANHVSEKKGYPSSNPWGKYLRVNHSKFSGDTAKYPYEPELPNINGCGGTYQYYEVDVGANGYNNGSSISRGSCRIVYSRFNGNEGITDLSEKYLFYTYNHYNDFQEYLNYYNGWGDIFGNYTGGGISKPTPYVQVIKVNFSTLYEYSPLGILSEYLN